MELSSQPHALAALPPCREFPATREHVIFIARIFSDTYYEWRSVKTDGTVTLVALTHLLLHFVAQRRLSDVQQPPLES